jgi:hypothetical protein
MADLAHWWNADLLVSSTGDFAVSDSVTLTQQRVLRRLLTNPGDYIWHLGYGGGLARFVGAPADPPLVKAIIRGQLMLEPQIAQDPEPMIEVTWDQSGTVFVEIRYSDNDTSSTQMLSFSVSE